MVEAVLEQTGRKVLTIDCRKLHDASSDSALVKALAIQTGYWPVFTFLSSMNSLLDLASVGLIGQKGKTFFLLHIHRSHLEAYIQLV
jgi:hypothetical protein